MEIDFLRNKKEIDLDFHIDFYPSFFGNSNPNFIYNDRDLYNKINWMVKAMMIKLKVHAPMIHFHAKCENQDGCCLRGSDVKPRLIEFLKSKGVDIPPNHLMIRIENDDQNQPQTREPNPKGSFFGNIGKNNDGKLLLLGPPGYLLKMQIHHTRFDPEKEKEIEKHLPEFFALHNFGTRSNKGYGCFFPIAEGNSDGWEYFEKVLRGNKSIAPVFYWNCNDPSYLKVEESINVFYKVLKTGFHLKSTNPRSAWNLTIDSLLSKELGTDAKKEKAAISNALFSGKSSSSDSKTYIRALLGLSDNQSWGKKYDNAIIEIKCNDESIERVPSPIIFKVYNYNDQFRIYFYTLSYYEKLHDKSFKFKYRGKYVDLKTPKAFDIKKFIKSAVSNFNSLQITPPKGIPPFLKNDLDMINEIKPIKELK